jgi:hypothetical protein
MNAIFGIFVIGSLICVFGASITLALMMFFGK